jgi:hypothetical protein
LTSLRHNSAQAYHQAARSLSQANAGDAQPLNVTFNLAFFKPANWVQIFLFPVFTMSGEDNRAKSSLILNEFNFLATALQDELPFERCWLCASNDDLFSSWHNRCLFYCCANQRVDLSGGRSFYLF